MELNAWCRKLHVSPPGLCMCVHVCMCWQEGVSIDRVHPQVTSPYRDPSAPVETLDLQAPQVLQ